MNTKEDLQDLLKPQHREELIVLPRRVVRFAFLSIGILCMGIGIGLGAVPAISQLGTPVFEVCVAAALVLGWRINRMEAGILKRYARADSGECPE